jgi:GNAT superfamily N-acetyltransferase
MRKATDDDVERFEEIWRDAYGDYAEGDATFDYLIENASWGGALEAGGEVVAFAFNGDVDGAEGEILEAAVAPEAWGHGYGRVILAAAAYQLTTRDAARATVRVRPDIKQSLRTASDLGFRFQRSGLEFRRIVDEDEIARRRDARRVAGVKARFGNWK